MTIPRLRTALLGPLALTFLLTACSVFNPTAFPFPTPKVPDLFEIQAAIDRWAAGNNQRYFVEVQETLQEQTRVYRIVIADGQIRAAQSVEKLDGEWQPPVSVDEETAGRYTVDALLERIYRDANGQGPAPMDMIASFDSISGFPLVVETHALPTTNEAGEMITNWEHSYALAVNVGILIEDTTGFSKVPLLTVYRSGGSQAWCDVLRIFEDGSSVYNDDCRQTLLQLRPPVESYERLQALAAEYSEVEQEDGDDGLRRVILHGTGSAELSGTDLEELWTLTDLMTELLSRPVGAGITLLYREGSALFGFDMRANQAQAASLEIRPPFFGALSDASGQTLAFSDAAGLHWLATATGETGLFVANPDGRHYLPRGWSASGKLIAARLTNASESLPEWGWTSQAERTWHPLPVPEGGWSCDSGIAVDPTQERLVIAGAAEGDSCALQPGLWLVDLAAGTAAPVLQPGDVLRDGAEIAGGAYRPAWSPDGEWIAVVLDEEVPEITGTQAPEITGASTTARLYLVRPDGSQLTPLSANLTGRVSAAIWSPDGRAIYYAISGSQEQADGLYRTDAGGAEHTLVLGGVDLVPLSVSPSQEFLVYTIPAGLRVWLLFFDQGVPVATPAGEINLQFVGWLDARTNP